MIYKENLPRNCPPQKVKAPKVRTMWRLTDSRNVSHSDFVPHAAKFPNRRYPNRCRALSISLATSKEVVRAIVKHPSPNLAGLTHVVEVHYEKAAGVWDQDKPTHVSLWLAKDFDILTIIGNTEKIR